MPSLVDFGSVVLEKEIFKFCQCIFISSFYIMHLPLKILVEISQVVFEEDENEKSLQKQTTGKCSSEKLTCLWHRKSSGEQKTHFL